jgi:hypothetical protein
VGGNDIIRVVHDEIGERRRSVDNPAFVVSFVLVMVAVIVGVDLLFFRHNTWFWERLAANIGIVLVFGAFYFRFR